MSADILSDPTHPHGTSEGFQRGCRGSHCPAPITCRDFHVRYQGDYAFRKAIDAGLTPEQIIEREQQQAAAAVAAAKAAKLAKASQIPGKVRGARQYVKKEPGVPITENQKRVLALHSEGLTDGEIADRMGKTRTQINATRHHLRLQPNRAEATDSRIRVLHARGLSDIRIAKELGRNLEHVRKRRRDMKLPLNPHRPPVIVTADLIRLHGEGLTDRQIGERLKVDPRYVARRRRKLHLTPNQAPASSGAFSS